MTIIDLARAYRSAGWNAARPSLVFVQYAMVAALHLGAIAYLYRFEYGAFKMSLALLAWSLLNCFWLVVLRRPAVAAALSLLLTGALILLSQFKFEIQWMTVTFLDLLIVGPDTTGFLMTIFPQLRFKLLLAALVVVPLLALIWRLDSFRVRRKIPVLAGAASLSCLTALSLAVPEEPWESFQGVNHLSNFARSGVAAVTEYFTHGILESDPTRSGQPDFAAGESCRVSAKRPHIIMVLDESSFDITAAPGIKVPEGYRNHFRSFDGKARSLVVESTGGPTWYAEYNVLTGLSARSFGRFKFHVTRIAAGRVHRGLPQALRRCGYKTITLYPAGGAFLSARSFQKTTGVERFIDQYEMGAGDPEPDQFYYEQTIKTLRRERGNDPLFIFVYLTANHFPWTSVYRRDLTPGWKNSGNDREVDEYLRRQSMSAHAYADFLARLKQDYPKESFLLVRFGDHQPAISAKILDPSLDDDAVARRIMDNDPRYFTTYYAIDTVNFTPADVSSALETLEAPYLPLVIQQAAGLPLDATYVEQKRILDRCRGEFYGCAGGAEARRFNRLLIDAGLIKGL